jgi:hypothetical protein
MQLFDMSRHPTGFAQERAWPRTGAVTQWRDDRRNRIIPTAIVNASYEAAFLELTNPGSLSPVVNGSATVKRETVGQLEVEYSSSTSNRHQRCRGACNAVMTVIEGLLSSFLMPVVPGIHVV